MSDTGVLQAYLVIMSPVPHLCKRLSGRTVGRLLLLRMLLVDGRRLQVISSRNYSSARSRCPSAGVHDIGGFQISSHLSGLWQLPGLLIWHV